MPDEFLDNWHGGNWYDEEGGEEDDDNTASSSGGFGFLDRMFDVEFTSDDEDERGGDFRLRDQVFQPDVLCLPNEGDLVSGTYPSHSKNSNEHLLSTDDTSHHHVVPVDSDGSWVPPFEFMHDVEAEGDGSDWVVVELSNSSYTQPYIVPPMRTGRVRLEPHPSLREILTVETPNTWGQFLSAIPGVPVPNRNPSLVHMRNQLSDLLVELSLEVTDRRGEQGRSALWSDGSVTTGFRMGRATMEVVTKRSLSSPLDSDVPRREQPVTAELTLGFNDEGVDPDDLDAPLMPCEVASKQHQYRVRVAEMFKADLPNRMEFQRSFQTKMMADLTIMSANNATVPPVIEQRLTPAVRRHFYEILLYMLHCMDDFVVQQSDAFVTSTD